MPMLVDDAARPFFRTLPGDVVPPAAARDVGERRRRASLLVTRQAGLAAPQVGMHTQLEDGIDAAAGLASISCRRVEIPRIDHQRLLADGVRPDPQRQPDMGIVQVVGRADIRRSGRARASGPRRSFSR